MKQLSLIIINLTALVSLVGCAAPAAAVPTGQAEAAPVRVEVILTEFAVESSVTEFEVGKTYEFVITNKGVIDHELRINTPTDAEAANAHGDDVHDDALLVVEAEDLQPNETVTVEYTFDEHATENSLEFACHIAGHYEANMRLPISLE